MKCEECSCLFIEQTVSYYVFYAPKILIFISEFKDNILLIDIVIVIVHILGMSCLINLCYFM